MRAGTLTNLPDQMISHSISCRRITIYPYHLQGQNSGLNLLLGIATAVLLQAFTQPNSYAQVSLVPYLCFRA